MNDLPIAGRTSVTLAALAITAGCLTLMLPAPQSAVRWITDVCTAVGRPVFATAAAPPGSGSRPATTVRQLSCEPLPDVPGKSVTTALVDFPPLAYSAAHRHPGSVTAVVLQGTIRSQMAGSPAADYKTGQTWFEPPRALHLFAENPDPAHPAQLLAFFVTDENCGPLVIPAQED